MFSPTSEGGVGRLEGDSWDIPDVESSKESDDCEDDRCGGLVDDVDGTVGSSLENLIRIGRRFSSQKVLRSNLHFP